MKKIMFNDPCGLTQATISGQKTMTRRVIKTPKGYYGFEVCKNNAGEVTAVYALDDEGEHIKRIKPKYKASEIVAVAQRYRDIFELTKKDEWVYNSNLKNFERMSSSVGWKNKMFIKAKLMHYHLKMDTLRAERLQDISDQDCLREGIIMRYIYIEEQDCQSPRFTYPNNKEGLYLTPQGAFASLIDKVSGKGTWESNPFVWVYEYELIENTNK